MAFMIVAVFIFFLLIALFFLQISMGNIRAAAIEAERRQVFESLKIFSEFPEVSCSDQSSNCLDEDKLYVLSRQDFNILYNDFWPVASIEVLKVNNNLTSLVACPQPNCNYFNVFDSGQQGITKYSTYVSLCRTNKRQTFATKECEMAKIILGMRPRG